MPLLSRVGSKVYGFAADSLRAVLDSFARTNAGSLGLSTSGSLWQAIRGVWYANNGVAQSDDTPSNNSIAVIPFREDAVITASVTSGTGAVFWLTDANSWWAAVPYGSYSSTCPNGNCSGSQTLQGSRGCSCYSTNCSRGCSCYNYNTTCSRSCSCTTVNSTCTRTCSCTQQTYYGFSSYACTSSGGTVTGPSYCTFNYTNCSNGSCSGTESYSCSSQSSNCSNGSCSGTESYACQQSASTCNSGACSGSEIYSCQGSTCNSGACSGSESYNYDQSCSCTYSYLLRLINSVGGAVSTYGSDLTLSSAAAAIALTTTGNTISTTAYSDAARTTSLGTRTDTPTTPTRGTSVGIIKTQSGYNQGSTVSNFSATLGV